MPFEKEKSTYFNAALYYFSICRSTQLTGIDLSFL